MPSSYQAAIGNVCISDPILYVDNQSRHRSGHMSHAMIEYAPGKIIDFNSNCSAERHGGHSAFGWIEYRYSDDYGQTFGEIHELPFSKEILLDGVYSVSLEKAVFHNGVLTCFLLRNPQKNSNCCDPWDLEPPLVIQSYDAGKSWEKPTLFCPWRGRIYDAVVKDGIIYVLQFSNPDFPGKYPDDVYRLFVSEDNGKTFSARSVVALPTLEHGYGALQFRPDGSLLAYNCNLKDNYFFGLAISHDNGLTWEAHDEVRLSEAIRNIQISPLGNGYIMHGRAGRGHEWGKGLIVYSSVDGITWDDGLLLEPEKIACYYSNNVRLKKPDGSETLLFQYSDGYDGARVNVMHRFISVAR